MSQLMSDYGIFIIKPEIRAVKIRTCQKFVHFILIKLTFTHIIFFFLVKFIIDTILAHEIIITQKR